jgi:predicted transcriptional regulator
MKDNGVILKNMNWIMKQTPNAQHYIERVIAVYQSLKIFQAINLIEQNLDSLKY